MKPMQGIQWVNCAFWMFVLKTDLYSFMGFVFSIYIQYVSELAEDRARSYLPHPTLPILNG